MDQWKRIGDDEFAGFGKRDITFPIDDLTYAVHVDDKSQGGVWVTYGNRSVFWFIEVKESDGSLHKLSGITWGYGDPHFDLQNLGHWFELTLDVPASMRFWGHRIIDYEDYEVLGEISAKPLQIDIEAHLLWNCARRPQNIDMVIQKTASQRQDVIRSSLLLGPVGSDDHDPVSELYMDAMAKLAQSGRVTITGSLTRPSVSEVTTSAHASAEIWV